MEALCTEHGIAEAPFTEVNQRPPVTAAPTVTDAPIPPPVRTPMQNDWGSAYRQVRGLARGFANPDRDVAITDFYISADRISKYVMRKFRTLDGDSQILLQTCRAGTKAELAYHAMEDMHYRATASGEVKRARKISMALRVIDRITSEEVDRLTTKYGALDALSIQDIGAVQLPPPRVGSATSAALPATVPSTTAPPPGRLDVPGPHAASGLPGPSLAEAAGARAGDLGRWRLDPPATDSGATATVPVATETIVTPSLTGTSSFWLQPVDPVPSPGAVPFDSDLHQADVAVQTPPVTTTASSTAPALSPGAAFPTPSWLDDDFPVEPTLIAGELPLRLDGVRFIPETGAFDPFGLAEELAAGRLPIPIIDALIDGYRATDEGNCNAVYIEYLRSLKESIERALLNAYPERVDPPWLDQVRELLRLRGEPAAPSAASATSLPELDATVTGLPLGTGEGVSHPESPAAHPWRIRRPGMSGEPHPVAFDPWSAPPGPSGRVVYSEAIPTPVMSTGAPPGWQGAETPGFARAAAGAVELPFSRREAIVRRFGTEDALLEAEVALRAGDADELGWSATRRREVLADIHRLNAIVQLDPAAAATMVDVDWSAIEALGFILDAVPHSP